MAELTANETAILNLLKSGKPSTAKQLVQVAGGDVVKSKINSALYSLEKKGLTKKSSDTCPIWSVVQPSVKHLVIIAGDKKIEWLGQAAELVSESLRIHFYTLDSKAVVPKGIEKHLYNEEPKGLVFAQVAINLVGELMKNEDAKIILSTTDMAWQMLLDNLKKGFNVKSKIVSQEWKDVEKKLE